MKKLLNFLAAYDDPEKWSSFWIWPFMAFACGSVFFSLIQLWEPAGWCVGGTVSCIIAYQFNRTLASVNDKPDE